MQRVLLVFPLSVSVWHIKARGLWALSWRNKVKVQEMTGVACKMRTPASCVVQYVLLSWGQTVEWFCFIYLYFFWVPLIFLVSFFCLFLFVSPRLYISGLSYVQNWYLMILVIFVLHIWSPLRGRWGIIGDLTRNAFKPWSKMQVSQLFKGCCVHIGGRIFIGYLSAECVCLCSHLQPVRLTPAWFNDHPPPRNQASLSISYGVKFNHIMFHTRSVLWKESH